MRKSEYVLKDLGIEHTAPIGSKIKFYLAQSWALAFIWLKILWGVFRWLQKPRWAQLDFIERTIVTPIYELFAGERSASKAISKITDKYYQALKQHEATGANLSIRADLENIMEIVSEYKVIKTVMIGILALLYIGGFTLIWAIWDYIWTLTSISSLIASVSLFPAKGYIGASLFIPMFFSILLRIVVGIPLLAYTFFMIIAGWRLAVVMIKSLNNINKEELEVFVDGMGGYLFQKIEDLDNHDLAINIRNAVIETVVTNQDFTIIRDDVFTRTLDQITLGNHTLTKPISEAQDGTERAN